MKVDKEIFDKSKKGNETMRTENNISKYDSTFCTALFVIMGFSYLSEEKPTYKNWQIAQATYDVLSFGCIVFERREIHLQVWFHAVQVTLGRSGHHEL